MLLNSAYCAEPVPVEVCLTLKGMANPKSDSWEAHNRGHQSNQAPAQRVESGSLSKQQSVSSSRASLEASIDALVDVQLARLAEAAKEPDLGRLAKEALVRTASAPEADAFPPKQLPAQTSGLDWSGSIEPGPTLIGRRQDSARLQEVESPQPLRLPQKAKSDASPLVFLGQEPMDVLGEDLTSRHAAIQEAASPAWRSDDSTASYTPVAAHSNRPPKSSSGRPPKSTCSSKVPLPSASSAQAFESPFEAAQFQEEAIVRPVIVPEVDTDDIWKSASVPPSQVSSMLVGTSLNQAEVADLSGGSNILRDVVELLKGASEPPLPEVSGHLSDFQRLASPPRTSLEVPEAQQGYKRQAGMKSLSVLETEGIPIIRNGTLTQVDEHLPLALGVTQEQDSTSLRMNLTHGGGFTGQAHAHGHSHQNSRPSSARTGGLIAAARSLTVPSIELRKALDELQREGYIPPSSLATLQSGMPCLQSPGAWGEDDMAAATTLQEDITHFHPVDDLISAKSPPRAPSLFDLTAPSLTQESAEWLISWDEIELGRRIGAGSYGEVFRAQWRHTDVAVKRLQQPSESSGGLTEFKAEVNLMSKLKHPNIVQFLGACVEYPNLSIVTQFMPRGSLFNLLHRAKVRLDYRQKLWMALDVAKGMLYLHSCRPPIVHGDVSSKNMLVDRDFTIRVADFGMSRQRRKAMLSAKSQGGTAEWTAPEVLRGLPYHEKADVFSFGVILYEFMTQTAPWNELSTIQVVGAVGWGNAQLKIPEDIPKPMQDLMAACMDRDPQKRPDFEEIIVSLRAIRREVQLALTQRPQDSQRRSLDTRRQAGYASRNSLENSDSEADEVRARRAASLESRRTM